MAACIFVETKTSAALEFGMKRKMAAQNPAAAIDFVITPCEWAIPVPLLQLINCADTLDFHRKLGHGMITQSGRWEMT